MLSSTKPSLVYWCIGESLGKATTLSLIFAVGNITQKGGEGFYKLFTPFSLPLVTNSFAIFGFSVPRDEFYV